jgi:hypothetical protein
MVTARSLVYVYLTDYKLFQRKFKHFYRVKPSEIAVVFDVLHDCSTDKLDGVSSRLPQGIEPCF